MRKEIYLTVGMLSLASLVGCSHSEAAKLSQENLDDLTLLEQVNAVVENVGVIDGYTTIVEGNSIAIQYTQDSMSDNNVVLADKKEGFPNIAMTLADQLSVVDYDELVIAAYKENSDDGIILVSATFDESEVDFDSWKDVRDDSPENFYNKYVDGYMIQGMVWDKLTPDTQDAIKSESKGDTGTDFWERYGSLVE
ncbi:hypothetical protein MKY91_09345 [Alkalicoccobacillus gibsonii]|uniref:Uncharacterized protein n=1 Tax=Alkalicoccobacillus gibsonii TaxID=79881 RepID=A0ABU9VHN2_9BACI